MAQEQKASEWQDVSPQELNQLLSKGNAAPKLQPPPGYRALKIQGVDIKLPSGYDSYKPVSIADFTSNPGGEGLYRMGSYDFTGGRVTKPEIQVPYSKVKGALSSGYKIHPDEVKRYEHDLKFEGRGPNLWDKTKRAFAAMTEPMPDTPLEWNTGERTLGSFVRSLPAALGNVEKMPFNVVNRTVRGVVGLPQNAVETVKNVAEGKAEGLEAVDPFAIGEAESKALGQDTSEIGPLAALSNVAGDVGTMYLTGKTIGGGWEGLRNYVKGRVPLPQEGVPTETPGGPGGPIAPPAPAPRVPGEPVPLEEAGLGGGGGAAAPEPPAEAPRSHSTGGALQPQETAGPATQTEPSQQAVTITQELEESLLDQVARHMEAQQALREAMADVPEELHPEVLAEIDRNGADAYARGDYKAAVEAAYNHTLLERAIQEYERLTPEERAARSGGLRGEAQTPPEGAVVPHGATAPEPPAVGPTVPEVEPGVKPGYVAGVVAKVREKKGKKKEGQGELQFPEAEPVAAAAPAPAGPPTTPENTFTGVVPPPPQGDTAKIYDPETGAYVGKEGAPSTAEPKRKGRKQSWEVFDPKDGKPIQTFSSAKAAREFISDKPNLDYARQGEGLAKAAPATAPTIHVDAQFPTPKETEGRWKEASESPELAKQFTRTGIPGFAIQAPYQFGLSEQGNIDPATGQINISAAAGDPIHTLAHELAHDIYRRLTPENRAIINGYVGNSLHIHPEHTGGLEERIVDHFADEIASPMSASAPPSIRKIFFESELLPRPEAPATPSLPTPEPLPKRQLGSWAEVESMGGHLQQGDDIRGLVAKDGDFPLVIKDTFGARHIMPASMAAEILDSPAHGYVREVWMAKDHTASKSIGELKRDIAQWRAMLDANAYMGHTPGNLYQPDPSKPLRPEYRKELEENVTKAEKILRDKEAGVPHRPIPTVELDKIRIDERTGAKPLVRAIQTLDNQRKLTAQQAAAPQLETPTPQKGHRRTRRGEPEPEPQPVGYTLEKLEKRPPSPYQREQDDTWRAYTSGGAMDFFAPKGMPEPEVQDLAARIIFQNERAGVPPEKIFRTVGEPAESPATQESSRMDLGSLFGRKPATPQVPSGRTRANIVAKETLPNAAEHHVARAKNEGALKEQEQTLTAIDQEWADLLKNQMAGNLTGAAPVAAIRDVQQAMDALAKRRNALRDRIAALEQDQAGLVDPEVGEVRLDANGRPTLWLNKTAMAIVRKIMLPGSTEGYLKGAAWTMPEARWIKRHLQNFKPADQNEELVGRPLMRLLNAAMDHAHGGDITVMGKVGLGIQEAVGTLREELLHRWQASRTQNGMANTHLPMNAFLDLYSSMPEAAVNYLKKQGYDEEERGGGIRLLVIEATAKIMAGKWSKMGLTKPEAARYLAQYFAAVTDAHGIDAVLEIEHTYGMARDFQKEVERLYGPGARAGQAAGRAGEAVPEVADTDRPLPRMEIGRNEEAGGDAAGRAGRGVSTSKDGTIEPGGEHGRTAEITDPREAAHQAVVGGEAGADDRGDGGGRAPAPSYSYTRRSPEGTESGRSLLGAPVLETWSLDPGKAEELLTQDGFQSPDIHELDYKDQQAAKVFREQLEKTKTNNPYASSVYVYPLEEYAGGMRVFLSDDGKAGFALKPDGDIVSVFVHGDGPRGAVHTMLEIAKQAGGTKLDCFDTILPAIYRRHEFKIVGRMPWNEEYKPEGWDYETYKKYNNGRPDVVFMEHDPAKIDVVHYSNAPDIEKLDPSYYGQNKTHDVSGQVVNRPDLNRKNSFPQYWSPESYVGDDTDPQFREQAGERFRVRQHTYKGQVSAPRIYDLANDPDGILGIARKELEIEKFNKLGVRLQPSDAEVNAYAIKKLKDLGYSGRRDINGMIASWEKIPVRQTGVSPSEDVGGNRPQRADLARDPELGSGAMTLETLKKEAARRKPERRSLRDKLDRFNPNAHMGEENAAALVAADGQVALGAYHHTIKDNVGYERFHGNTWERHFLDDGGVRIRARGGEINVEFGDDDPKTIQRVRDVIDALPGNEFYIDFTPDNKAGMTYWKGDRNTTLRKLDKFEDRARSGRAAPVHGSVSYWRDKYDEDDRPTRFDLERKPNLTWRDIRPFLLPEELEAYQKNPDLRDKIVSTVNMMPNLEEWDAATKAGESGRLWFERSSRAFDALMDTNPDAFQPGDKDKFLNFVAALSPVQPVRQNLVMAINLWDKWNQAGRPQDVEWKDAKNFSGVVSKNAKLYRILKGYGSTQGVDLPARMNNAIRALQGQPLSGPKVSSFAPNLGEDVNRVTNDTWIAVFADTDPNRINQKTTYEAVSSIIRQVAKKNKIPPRQAMSAIWSFIKALAELSGWGQDRWIPPQEIIKQGLLTPELINEHAQDFADLLKNDPEIRAKIKKIGGDLDELDRQLKERVPARPEADQERVKRLGERLVGSAHRLETARANARIQAHLARKQDEGGLFSNDTSFEFGKEVVPGQKRSTLEDLKAEAEARRRHP